jgi:hypothetical protein
MRQQAVELESATEGLMCSIAEDANLILINSRRRNTALGSGQIMTRSKLGFGFVPRRGPLVGDSIAPRADPGNNCDVSDARRWKQGGDATARSASNRMGLQSVKRHGGIGERVVASAMAI